MAEHSNMSLQNKLIHGVRQLYDMPPLFHVFLFSGIHVLVSLYYRYSVGFLMGGSDNVGHWDSWPQTIPADLLLTRPFESIWYFHAQPPLFNVLGAVLAQMTGGDGALMIQYLYTFNILIGTLTVAVIFLTAYYALPHLRWLALIIGLLVTFAPSIFAYEAFLYTVLEGFLAALTVFGVARYSQTRRLLDLTLSIISLNILILTRSAYHPVLLVPVILVLSVAAGKRWRQMLSVSILASSVTVLWLVKNAVVFGFIGLTSWTGLNLWQIVSWDVVAEDRLQYAEAGVVNQMVAEQNGFFTFYFNDGEVFHDYGFDKTSDIPILSQSDLHGINVPDISAVYLESALSLIAHEPVHYIQRSIDAYSLFSCPPSSFFWLDQNVSRMERHAGLYYQLEGYRLFENDAIKVPVLNVNPCSFTFFTLPLSALIWVVIGLTSAGLSWRGWVRHIHRYALMWVLFGLIVYTALVGSLTEYVENARFRYPIEFLLWIFYAGLLHYLWFNRSGDSRADVQ